MTADELFAKWDVEAGALRRRGALVNGADLVAELLADVRAVLTVDSGAVLTLGDAATRSGYSSEHLGRLVRDGHIPNAGRAKAPRIRVADLPRKPQRVAAQPSGPYDSDTDARSLLSRQRGGRHA